MSCLEIIVMLLDRRVVLEATPVRLEKEGFGYCDSR